MSRPHIDHIEKKPRISGASSFWLHQHALLAVMGRVRHHRHHMAGFHNCALDGFHCDKGMAAIYILTLVIALFGVLAEITA